MTRLYGRSAKGARVYDHAPHGHWCTTTMISSIRLNGETACMAVDAATSGDVFRACVGHALVPIYAPDPYAAGSSLSHLDTGTFPEYMMSHAIAIGDTRRPLSDFEIAMMADMGWDVIPEPATIVTVLLAASGFYGIRRFFLV